MLNKVGDCVEEIYFSVVVKLNGNIMVHALHVMIAFFISL